MSKRALLAQYPIHRCDGRFACPPRTGSPPPQKPRPRRCQQRRLKFLFRPAISISIFNGLVHCVFADRALTCQAAGRRKTKPSGREARGWLGDHDPPTPMDKAERSARVLSEQTPDRDQFHPGLWPLSFPPVRFPQHAAALGHADTLAKE
jgi:hypothetical protein